MEEPQGRAGGSSPLGARGITSKLPSDNIIDAVPEQDETNQAEESLEFVVVEGFQVGRGVARMEQRDMARLGCQPGDIVMITGGRTTAARVLPGSLGER